MVGDASASTTARYAQLFDDVRQEGIDRAVERISGLKLAS